MQLQNRINNIVELGLFYKNNNEELEALVENAHYQNAWFIPSFIHKSLSAIASNYCDKDLLENFVQQYFTTEPSHNTTVGIVMAGNIPLVGFHDLLCAYLCGHNIKAKLAQKDTVLMQHAIQFLNDRAEGCASPIEIVDNLKNCDAYIATGSNNTARYFEQYFGKYHHIIRKSKTSVAVLTGQESSQDLEMLSNDIFNYFGLGCRNVTKIMVPAGYNFEKLIDTLKNNTEISNHNKYTNNFDYNLALCLLNKQYYMTDGKILLLERESLFSAIATLHYQYYTDYPMLIEQLQNHPDTQAIVGKNQIPFGHAQQPNLLDYADGVDTMQFLVSIN